MSLVRVCDNCRTELDNDDPRFALDLRYVLDTRDHFREKERVSIDLCTACATVVDTHLKKVLLPQVFQFLQELGDEGEDPAPVETPRIPVTRINRLTR